MNRWNRATVAGLGLLLTGWLSIGVASAQIHATPPSVTSMGFGGRAINGPAPSVTSVGPLGFTFNPAFPNSHPHFGTNPGFVGHGPHHRPRHPQGGGYYGIPYYGYYENGYDHGADAQNYATEDEYNGGPTVFDRRGAGYVPRPPEPDRQTENAASNETEPQSEPSTPTVLVFKDGHQLEVENYAIVGATLYDLTEGHRRKVALSELDLTATSKQNDDRGVDFHLPSGTVDN